MLGNINRGVGRYPQCNRIRRAGVDLDGLSIQAQVHPCVEDMIAQVIDDYLFNFSTEIFNHISQQIMCHWAGGLDALQSAVDGKNLDDADYDRKTPMAVTLFEDDHLLVGHFINDYT
ncbi:MAG: hypothetical protein AMJ75_12330 [Phycisphaerae bacterium SM1_79]|nr:MAG: hypothetical protein AMJ75_12330 [Phycisphaerae bacterium SM1_79]